MATGINSMKLKKMMEMDFIRDFRTHLETPFEHRLFEASLRNYCSHGNPLRFNNFAFAMRELVTNILNRKAPEMDVVSAPWYTQVSPERKVTRKQQLKYCAQKHIPDNVISDKTLDKIKEKTKKYNQEYMTFNKYTHITEKYFNNESKAVFNEVKQLIELTSKAYDIFDELENVMSEEVLESIDAEIREITSDNIPDEVDILSSCTHVNNSETTGIRLITMTNEFLYFLIEGTIYITRQYGKGEEFYASGDHYPFWFAVSVSAQDFSSVKPLNVNVMVDTSAWYAQSEEDQAYQSLINSAEFLSRIDYINISTREKEKLFPGVSMLHTSSETKSEATNASYTIEYGVYDDLPF